MTTFKKYFSAEIVKINQIKVIGLTACKVFSLGSGCGSVGRMIASDSRGLRFESSHQQNFIYIEHLFTVNCVLKRRK